MTEAEDALSLTLNLGYVLLDRGLASMPIDRYDSIYDALWANPDVREMIPLARLSTDRRKFIDFLDGILFSPLSTAPDLRELGRRLLKEA